MIFKMHLFAGKCRLLFENLPFSAFGEKKEPPPLARGGGGGDGRQSPLVRELENIVQDFLVGYG